nr:uncharacterized protein LOC129274898 [Lytechinus pictus]
MSSLKQPLSPCVIPLLKDSQQTPAKTPHAHISKYADPKLLSSTWALDIRKDINLQEERGERPDNSLINDLITELSAVFISALQRNSRHQWLYLAEVLRICLPYSQYLQDDDQASITPVIDS